MNSGWIKTEERKPQRDGFYLICNQFHGHWITSLVSYYTASGRFNDPGDCPECAMDATYWRELPEAPK